jgi:hypothetical protein
MCVCEPSDTFIFSLIISLHGRSRNSRNGWPTRVHTGGRDRGSRTCPPPENHGENKKYVCVNPQTQFSFRSSSQRTSAPGWHTGRAPGMATTNPRARELSAYHAIGQQHLRVRAHSSSTLNRNAACRQTMAASHAWPFVHEAEPHGRRVCSGPPKPKRSFIKNPKK